MTGREIMGLITHNIESELSGLEELDYPRSPSAIREIISRIHKRNAELWKAWRAKGEKNGLAIN